MRDISWIFGLVDYDDLDFPDVRLHRDIEPVTYPKVAAIFETDRLMKLHRVSAW